MKRILCLILILITIILTCTACSPSKNKFDNAFNEYMNEYFITDYTFEGTSCNHITVAPSNHKNDDVIYYHCSVNIPVRIDFIVTCKAQSKSIFSIKKINTKDNYSNMLSRWLTEEYGTIDISELEKEDVVYYVLEHLQKGKDIYSSVITGRDITPSIDFTFIYNKKIYKYTARYANENMIREDLEELMFGKTIMVV